MLVLYRHNNDRATNSRVCFYWHHVCDLVKFMTVHYGVYGGSRVYKKATLGVNLLPTTSLTDNYTVPLSVLDPFKLHTVSHSSGSHAS